MSINHTIKKIEEGRVAIISLKEKHSDEFYVAKSKEQLLNTFVLIVKERHDNNYWEEPEQPRGEPTMSKEDIEKLKDGPVKKAAQDEWNVYERRLRAYNNEKYQWDNYLVKALAGDGLAAYNWLSIHSGYEYEGFDISIASEVVVKKGKLETI